MWCRVALNYDMAYYEGMKKEARKLLFKYKYTKLNKRYLIKIYIISGFPIQ